MSDPIDRDFVERLLREGHSRREAARIAGCSDWSARRIARELSGDDRPMKRARAARDDAGLGVGGWAVLVGIGAAFAGIIIWATRKRPEGGSMP